MTRLTILIESALEKVYRQRQLRCAHSCQYLEWPQEPGFVLLPPCTQATAIEPAPFQTPKAT